MQDFNFYVSLLFLLEARDVSASSSSAGHQAVNAPRAAEHKETASKNSFLSV